MTYSIVTLNAGHSAKAPGAGGHGYKEHEVARTIKDKLIKALNAVGQKTVDTTSDAATPSAVLSEQARKCNAVDKTNRLDVSIHLNAGGGTGAEVLYFDQKALAAKVSEAICAVTGYRNRGAKERKDLYFLRTTNAPSILIEVCFIDNAADMKILMAKMDAIVDAIVKAITGKESKGATEVANTNDNKPSAWAKESWTKATKAGVVDGARPQDGLTREEFTVIIDRLGLLK